MTRAPRSVSLDAQTESGIELHELVADAQADTAADDLPTADDLAEREARTERASQLLDEILSLPAISPQQRAVAYAWLDLLAAGVEPDYPSVADALGWDDAGGVGRKKVRVQWERLRAKLNAARAIGTTAAIVAYDKASGE